MDTIIIVGAGASGLACASTLDQLVKDARIMILEQSNKSARKILASGNGRCNLSNLDMNIKYYNTSHPTVEKIIHNFDPIHFFETRGMLVKKEGTLLYPYSNQSHTVKQTLLDSLHHVTLIEKCSVEKIIKEKDQYILHTNKGKFHATYVVIANGSCASKLSGENNEILLKQLHLSIQPLKPSLVALKTKPVYKKLKGIRVKANVSLYDGNHKVETRMGEVLFSDYGLSGICIMQLSRFYHNCKNPKIKIDLLPMYSKKEVEQLLQSRKETYGSYYLEGIFPLKLANVLASLKELDLKELTFDVIDTLDFSKAQVMSGGLDLDEVNEDLECLKYPNLYVVGEALDVDGDCGGYNLHFAFGSGYHVANAIFHKLLIK